MELIDLVDSNIYIISFTIGCFCLNSGRYDSCNINQLFHELKAQTEIIRGLNLLILSIGQCTLFKVQKKFLRYTKDVTNCTYCPTSAYLGFLRIRVRKGELFWLFNQQWIY